eukprot:c27773_g2_i2 orf=330-1379(+)
MSTQFCPSKPTTNRSCHENVDTTSRDTGNWWRVCHSKILFFGILATVTLILCSIMITGNQSEAGKLWEASNLVKNSTSIYCKSQENHHRHQGSESLPKGIVQETSDLKLRPLWTNLKVKEVKSPVNLLAMAVGIKLKMNVDKIIQKFPPENFTVMLFHYDGIVDEWNEFTWSSRAIHIAALNQTKWWFAKRFLHPDIVAAYNYIFVWDEDIGVDNFHASRYLAIVEDEGLEISQPALDPDLSEVHHPITIRRKRKRVHRRVYKYRGSGLCFENSTQTQCTGWVEMMVPVFSREAWQCAWYMIQNDLVHSWGMDMKLGYCAQGDRSRKVGIVDDQYIVHLGIPSLGGSFN